MEGQECCATGKRCCHLSCFSRPVSKGNFWFAINSLGVTPDLFSVDHIRWLSPCQGGWWPYDPKPVAPEGAFLQLQQTLHQVSCVLHAEQRVWMAAYQSPPQNSDFLQSSRIPEWLPLGRADLGPMLASLNPSRQVQMRQPDTICVLPLSMPRKKCSCLGSHGIYFIPFYPKLCVLSCNKQITSLVLHIFAHEISFQFFLGLSEKCLANCCIK